MGKDVELIVATSAQGSPHPFFSTVGAGVGSLVGSAVGVADGIAVGRLEGRLEGRDVGRLEGSDVGAGEGPELGTAVGAAVGAAVDAGAGPAVGPEVGSAAGSAVGSLEGDGVGSLVVDVDVVVGRAVGAAVGSATPTCATQQSSPTHLAGVARRRSFSSSAEAENAGQFVDPELGQMLAPVTQRSPVLRPCWLQSGRPAASAGQRSGSFRVGQELKVGAYVSVVGA